MQGPCFTVFAALFSLAGFAAQVAPCRCEPSLTENGELKDGGQVGEPVTCKLTPEIINLKPTKHKIPNTKHEL